MDNIPKYTVQRCWKKPDLTGSWMGADWGGAESISIDNFYARPEASNHRPRSSVKLLYDTDGVYLHFRVQDYYVRVVQEKYHSSVCGDSCVEWFVAPIPDAGYFNLEINAGGALLLYHVTGRLQDHAWKPVPEEWMNRIDVYHSLPKRIEPELVGETTWTVATFVPFDLFRAMLPGRNVQPSLEGWRCNFYKCADQTSHPHWASWQPVNDDPFTFHQPASFSPIAFA